MEEGMGEGRREKWIFHLLGPIPDGHNRWGWTKPRPEAISSVLVPHVSSRASNPWATLPQVYPSPGELEGKQSCQDSNWHLSGLPALQATFSHCYTTPALALGSPRKLHQPKAHTD